MSTLRSARKAFHSSAAQSLPCREAEVKKLKEFLLTHLEEHSCGSIYISGLPGTGKTASLNHVIEMDEVKRGYQIAKVNCTSVTSSGAIYKRICEELKIKLVGRTEKQSISAIETYLNKKHKMILLILDEIDQLETRSQSVLYKIFEWPSWEDAKFVLIGIANSMDLTDRILPRLCAKVELKPILMHFAPYTKDQIASILKHRLSEVGADGIFAPGALELISAKVAGMFGDIRRALDLGRRVMEMSEEKIQNKLSLEITPKKQAPIETDVLKPLNENVRKKSLRKLNLDEDDKSCSENSPPKISRMEISSNEVLISPRKSPRKQRNSLIAEKSPKKLPRKSELLVEEKSPKISPRKLNKLAEASHKMMKTPNKSPSKLNKLTEEYQKINTPKKSPSKMDKLVETNCKIESPSPRRSPRKLNANSVIRSPMKSPRKLDFTVETKDVLSVVKNIHSSSKNNLKSGEETCFPLHQKLVICTLLLVSKKGKAKDLNVARLHQVYSKVCSKRGITAVDQSGFLYLCRQVEMTGIIHLGKGPGKMAKVILQWDENEVANALKDQNLLSSILNDVNCLSVK